MLGEEGNNRIVQRGIDEALACRDRLAPAPAHPSLLARSVAWCMTKARALKRERPPRTRDTGQGAPSPHRNFYWGDILASRALSGLFPPAEQGPRGER
jgi:hypothetical protein